MLELVMYKCQYCLIEISSKGAYMRHVNACSLLHKYKNSIISDYANGMAIKPLSIKYGVNKTACSNLVKSMGIHRDMSGAAVLAHKLNPNSYKHTEDSKKKLRKKRLAWMKANPDKTAWRTRNEPSYPETLFMQICQENSLYDTYDIIREYCVFPHYIDFAFVNAKVAVEVDGSQHWLDKSRIESDIRKDNNLLQNGWRIMRIPEFKLKDSYAQVTSDVLTFLSDLNITEKRYPSDIIDYECMREQVRSERNEKNRIATELRKKTRIAKSNALKKSRYEDFIAVYPKWGWTVALGKKWGISSQKSSKYCKKHFMLQHGG